MLFWTHIYYVHNVLQDIVVVILCTSIFILLHQQLTFDITPKKMTIKGLSTIFHLYFFQIYCNTPSISIDFCRFITGVIWNSSNSQTTLKKRRYSTKFLLLYVLLHKTLYCVFGAFGFCLYKAWNQFTYFIYVS